MKLKNKTLMHKMSLALAPVALLMTVQAASAGEIDSLTDAFKGGKTNFATQYRYETVETPNGTKGQAKASTLGARLGYETGDFHDFSGTIQYQAVMANKQYDNFQGTAGGQTANLNAVADPGGAGVVQAHLTYKGIADTTIKQGRQVIRYDDDRWVGNVDWRQSWQSFDATSITNKSLANTTIQAAYVTNVNRVIGTEATGGFAGDTHMKSTLLNVNNKSMSFADLVFYNYRLDYTAQVQANAATDKFGFGSTNTTGLKVMGNASAIGDYKLSWVAEYAQQKDNKLNNKDYNAKYTNLNAKLDMNFATIQPGMEILGANNGASVQTPLATLFAFNGWADKFLVTPTIGLKDTYVKARSNAMGIVYGADFHQFKSDTGNLGLGRELDLIAEKQIDKVFAVGARAARYKASTETVSNTASANAAAGGIALTDTNKMWLYGSMKF